MLHGVVGSTRMYVLMVASAGDKLGDILEAGTPKMCLIYIKAKKKKGKQAASKCKCSFRYF